MAKTYNYTLFWYTISPHIAWSGREHTKPIYTDTTKWMLCNDQGTIRFTTHYSLSLFPCNYSPCWTLHLSGWSHPSTSGGGRGMAEYTLDGGSSVQASLCCYAQEDTLPCALVSRSGVMHLSQLFSKTLALCRKCSHQHDAIYGYLLIWYCAWV